MNAIGDAVVAEARRWLGTPYREGASTLGRGCDCAGLLIACAAVIGLDLSGRRGAGTPGSMQDVLDVHLSRLALTPDARARDQALALSRPGDVLVFRRSVGGHPLHGGIRSDLHEGRVGVVHAHQGIGRVVETGLDGIQLRLLYGIWRWRGTR